MNWRTDYADEHDLALDCEQAALGYTTKWARRYRCAAACIKELADENTALRKQLSDEGVDVQAEWRGDDYARRVAEMCK